MRRIMLDAAMRLMQDGVVPSISDVAQEAQVSRATAYRYYPTQSVLIQAAVDEANQAVSRAESIRRFRILDVDFTQESGQLSVKMSLRRSVLYKDFAEDVEALYS